MTIYGVGFWPQLVSNPSAHAQAIYNLGCREIRLVLSWAEVQPAKDLPPSDWNWSNFDQFVTVCAQNSLTVLPILTRTPGWVYPNLDPDLAQRVPPDESKSPGSLSAWMNFCFYAAQRYGPGGTFWQTHSLTPFPIRLYEILNEPNINDQTKDYWVSSGDYVKPYVDVYNYARFGIKAQNPSLEAMVGGLAYVSIDTRDGSSSDPVADGGYLDRLKGLGIVTPDAVGYHPYGFSTATDGSATTAHTATINRVKFFDNKLTNLGWSSGRDITEDGIPQTFCLEPSCTIVVPFAESERSRYFSDTARVIEDSYTRVRRYHAYTWYVPPTNPPHKPPDETWNLANADASRRPAADGYKVGIDA
jgi:hypothetical protein